MVIGVIPSNVRTYEVYGDFNIEKPEEGHLYYDPNTKRVYYYSLIEKRSNPRTGYFPIWNGKSVFISKFSNEKYFDKDVIVSDINELASHINKTTADDILLKQMRSDCGDVLKPQLCDGDNMFTQCIKGTICALDVTTVDLVEMSTPRMEPKMIDNYYSSLNKISFMRLEKWNVWLNNILHLGYELDVFKGNKKILSYSYPSDDFDTGVVKYNQIIKSSKDPLKRIVKILMVMENIDKKALHSEDVDDYTVNNMMTTLNGNKPLSAQLFSRFTRMTGLTYAVRIIKDDKTIFEYRE